MEIKSILNKPYNDKEKISFIVEQNHKKGYEIKETDTALEAWGSTAKEIDDIKKQACKKELIVQLNELDIKTVRALRAIHAGRGTEEDKAQLEKLEGQAELLREELHALNDGEVAV